MRRLVPLSILCLMLASLAVVHLDPGNLFRALWPALVSVAVILLTKRADLGLGCGVASGAVLLAGGDVLAAPRLALHAYVFPSVRGPWREGALLFSLMLGSFAAILERSGGFETLLRAFLSRPGDPKRQVLMGAYAVGILCFFDGLASTLLTGRLLRPLVDRAGVSRERLSWVVDSTGSPVACVAFISTWIAEQLSLIDQGLRHAPFPVEPYQLFFRSIPANAYCLLTLLLVPLAIWLDLQPRSMRRFGRHPEASEVPAETHGTHPSTVLIPLAALVVGILAGFPLFCDHHVNVFTTAGWREAFSGDGGPYALVFGSFAGLMAAVLAFPRRRRPEIGPAAVMGAGALLPALVVLMLAWSLGSMFEALGAAKLIAGALSSGATVHWLPCAVFTLGCGMAFCTGTSWGTMALLMPLSLPTALALGHGAGLDPDTLQTLCVATIGAVFGGATFGDHCSPFSDTTIVAALASGCDTMDHVVTQLPFAMLAALSAEVSYAAIALGTPAWAATLVAAACMLVALALMTRWRAPGPQAVAQTS